MMYPGKGDQLQRRRSARASGAQKQRQLLEEEGVQFDERGRIDLKIFGWQGASTEPGTAIPILKNPGGNMYFASTNRYDTMKYNRCGRSGLKLPAISLGWWYNFGGLDLLENGRAIARSAFEHGRHTL